MKAQEITRMFRRATFLGRHGDVVLVQTDGATPPTEATPLDAPVLAEGEVTGHAHRLDRGEVRRVTGALFQRLAQLAQPTALDHEEHQRREVPAGTIRSGIQAQWTPEGLRRVVD